MNNQNTMAQQPQPQPPQQPPYFQRPPPAATNGMSPPPFPPSPQLRYPTSQPYSYPAYPQPPASKRPRLSPGAQSPNPQPNIQMVQSPVAGSPLNGPGVNGFTPGSRPPGSMGPPSRPPDRAQEERNFDDILAGTGINIEEEDRRLTNYDSFSPSTPGSSFQSQQPSFGSFGNGSQDIGRRDSNSGYGPVDQSGLAHIPELTAEEIRRRVEMQADWQAGKHAQHPLWRSFLFGDNLQRRITALSYTEHLKAPMEGILRPQPNAVPQPTIVNGPDGASRHIENGETILLLGQGDGLRELLNVLSLAAKERLSGVIDLSARLSRARQQHSQGRVPNEWASIAAVAASTPAAEGDLSSPTANKSLKRAHSQAEVDTSTSKELITGPHKAVGIFAKVLESERLSEAGRAAKRAKRNVTANPDGDQSTVTSAVGPDTPGGASQDSEKKVTKKDRKANQSKFSEQEQHRSANETARLATSNIRGVLGKKKQYSWLAGGSGASSTTPTPTKTNTGSASTSAAATPGNAGTRSASKVKLLGEWNEENDPGIQARDVLLVLETDGKAPRTYSKGYSKVEG